MALLTTLQLNDSQNDYKVADFRCRYARHYNHYTPDTIPSCEQIELTVVAPETDDYIFYEWFINNSLLSGKICYELPITLNNVSSEVRTIEFTDARCYAFTESYDIDKWSRRLLKITIVPDSVKVGYVSFKHP
jgi:hypothetical protein